MRFDLADKPVTDSRGFSWENGGKKPHFRVVSINHEEGHIAKRHHTLLVLLHWILDLMIIAEIGRVPNFYH
ncbi:hypothetical protein GCM10023115_24360 [Pontixanthobacter gangjinensis]|uniref:Uncharacterized protein n=1 Tax=Pontixanthobacter gangjinensis TaxID=1028742 RepID=A0A6I4SPC2_9SPHN|nr:hypothetical protein [Pontixanthobacter gangjinensis]MXO57675.1 hypothetical protein [Pontixanthobacter gangjinensis]